MLDSNHPADFVKVHRADVFVVLRLFEKRQIRPQSPLGMGRASKYAGGGIKLQADLTGVWGGMRDI